LKEPRTDQFKKKKHSLRERKRLRRPKKQGPAKAREKVLQKKTKPDPHAENEAGKKGLKKRSARLGGGGKRTAVARRGLVESTRVPSLNGGTRSEKRAKNRDYTKNRPSGRKGPVFQEGLGRNRNPKKACSDARELAKHREIIENPSQKEHTTEMTAGGKGMKPCNVPRTSKTGGSDNKARRSS